MRNVAYSGNVMQSTTPRFDATFEKTLPRAFFTKRPPIIKPSTSTDWRTLGIVGILALTFIATVQIVTNPRLASPRNSQGGVLALPAGNPDHTTNAVTAPPLPEVRRAAPVPVPGAPRAQLIHVRGIGTVENDRMPDGRLLTTTYKGELPAVGDLPRTGAQLGDMWFTRRDGHAWVLAPVAAGSSTVGWVDP